MNGHPENSTADVFRQEPYRILVCADKFQTGYDEPLLQTMYVDKILSGIRAVQTLSRLNRRHSDKDGVFVLDFMNDSDTIEAAFEPYYRTTILADETDPNKLHDLKDKIDGYQVYSDEQVDEVVMALFGRAKRHELDLWLDECVDTYRRDLSEDGQVEFKGRAKAFVRTYAFLSQVVPGCNVEWEKLYTFLNLLIPKLPAPVEEDLSAGILDLIDMESYRVERHAAMSIGLSDETSDIEPVPMSGGGFKREPEMDRLSAIIDEFNQVWAPGTDNAVANAIIRTLPDQVMSDTAYRNAHRNSDRQNAQIEHDAAMDRAMIASLSCGVDLYKMYAENPDFKRRLHDLMFQHTYEMLTESNRDSI